jgi:ferrous iron transport protein A
MPNRRRERKMGSTEHKTLKSVVAGENAFVVAINAGCKARTRLESLGIIPGVEVDVLSNGNGPMLVSVGESRVMVERGIAEKVFVG